MLLFNIIKQKKRQHVNVQGLVCYEGRLDTLNKISIIFNSKLPKLPEINKEYYTVTFPLLHCLINT
jgi:hypothetical protein